ncbi:MAG: 23S rRNA (adenine(2503)-C(2))-methyltransferase RlmN [Blautia sp.]|nr:23S rRNA (adenine(2503)-C(2))-methyltransferase RlmN [Blautia sp.]
MVQAEHDPGYDIRSMTRRELEILLRKEGQPAYRARQVFNWMHVKLAASYDEMSDIPLSLRERLKDWPLTVLKTETVQVSRLDGTRKYLFRLPDGCMAESVLMRYHHGNTVCVSSQVGCAMGCRFCASTLGGKVRDLLPSEMLEQVYRIQTDTKERVSHVVVMGTGEPLENYDNLVRFIHLLTGEEGLNISQRNITVSTCGIVPRIYDLAQEKLAVTLALSLHAPTDELRRQLMPIARKYTIEETLKACAGYFSVTGRRVTFEYSLISGVNDSIQHAKTLGQLLAPLKGHVNLIPVNPVRERSFLRSAHSDVVNFKNTLEKYGFHVTIRRELGSDIDGACGQLRAKREGLKEESGKPDESFFGD